MHPLSALVAAYGNLLKIPFDSEWRIKNQSIYATIRDEIAFLADVDPEAVQKLCEAICNNSN